MFIRNHTEDDYPLFVEWWESWGWQPIPYMFLPKNSVVVCDDEGNPVCAVFLYLTDTPIIWAENYISCKKSKDRKICIEEMTKSIASKAKELGGVAVMSTLKSAAMGRRLEKGGFQKTDSNMTTYILGV